MIPYENLSTEELVTHIEQTEKLDRADVNELIERVTSLLNWKKEQQQEIETLTHRNEKLLSILPIRDKEIETLRGLVGGLTLQLDAQFGTPCEQIRLAEEIESLRSDAKETDIALMACGDSYRDMKADRDEWKRRARVLYPHTVGVQLHIEAAKWFEDSNG